MRRRSIIIVILLLILGTLFFRFGVGTLSSPTIDYDLSEPTTLAITQGTVGSIGDLRVGLRFVDSSSAGVSIWERDGSGEDALSVDLILDVGVTRETDGLQVTLLDALPGANEAVIDIKQVDP